MRIMKLASYALIAFAFLFSTAHASADLFNGGFEAGLAGWAHFGDVAVVNIGLGTPPREGNQMAILSTATDGQTSFTFSGTPGLFFGGLAPPPGCCFKDITQETVRDFGAAQTFHPEFGSLRPFQFSVIAQQFTAAGGSTLSFDWNFLTDDLADYGIFAVDGQLALIGYSEKLNASTTMFRRETGYHTATVQLGPGLDHFFGVMVVDGVDGLS